MVHGIMKKFYIEFLVKFGLISLKRFKQHDHTQNGFAKTSHENSIFIIRETLEKNQEKDRVVDLETVFSTKGTPPNANVP